MRYSPWRELRRYPDVVVHRAELDGPHAVWCPRERVIVIDARLTRVQARCALAHELEHIASGDRAVRGTGGARYTARQERRADEAAARRLISLDDLADALSWALGSDELGEALHVTDHMAFVRCATLTGDEKALIEDRLHRKERPA